MGDTQEEQTWKERMAERLKTNYRLVVMNEDTFEEVNTYNSNLLRVGLIGGAILLTVSFLTSLFFLMTPIKNILIKVTSNTYAQTEELEQKIEGLESQLQAHQVWSEQIRKILVGDVDTLGTGYNHNTTDTTIDKSLNVPRIELDEKLRQTMDPTQQEIEEITTISLPQEEVPLGQRFFTPPISGELSKTFLPHEKHFGVDVIAPKNTAVKAALDGFVIAADWTLETGNTICIQHKDNIITFYKHNSALLKEVGNVVKAGEAIAIIGNTGDHSTGPHVHFELWHKGIPVDPGDYVNFN